LVIQYKILTYFFEDFMIRVTGSMLKGRAEEIALKPGRL